MPHHRRLTSRIATKDLPSLPPSSPMSSTATFTIPLSLLHPRKQFFTHRARLFALLALIGLATTTFLITTPSLSLSPLALRYAVPDSTHSDTHHVTAKHLDSIYLLATSASKKSKLKAAQPVALTRAQELAAVSSFLASLPQNVIPASVDPLRPIDPQLVLDFDTRSVRAPDEVHAMVHDFWAENPVVLYTKFYSASSRALKTIVGAMHLSPSPLIIDIDVRPDADVLGPLLLRLTQSTEFPVLFVGGKNLGGEKEVQEYVASGELQLLVEAAGATITSGSRGGKHGAKR